MPVVDGKGGIIPETAEMLITYRPKVPLMLGTTRDESALKLGFFLKTVIFVVIS